MLTSPRLTVFVAATAVLGSAGAAAAQDHTRPSLDEARGSFLQRTVRSSGGVRPSVLHLRAGRSRCLRTRNIGSALPNSAAARSKMLSAACRSI